MPWQEDVGERRKEVTVHPLMVMVPEDPTADELAVARVRLEADMGRLPEEAWNEVAREAMQRRVRALRAKEIIADIAERHGVDLGGGLGKVVRIRMEVSC